MNTTSLLLLALLCACSSRGDDRRAAVAVTSAFQVFPSSGRRRGASSTTRRPAAAGASGGGGGLDLGTTVASSYSSLLQAKLPDVVALPGEETTAASPTGIDVPVVAEAAAVRDAAGEAAAGFVQERAAAAADATAAAAGFVQERAAAAADATAAVAAIGDAAAANLREAGKFLTGVRDGPLPDGQAPTFAEYMRFHFKSSDVQSALNDMMTVKDIDWATIQSRAAEYQADQVAALSKPVGAISRAIGADLDKTWDAFAATIPASELSGALQKSISILENKGSLSDAVAALDMEHLGIWYAGVFVLYTVIFTFQNGAPTPIDDTIKLTKAEKMQIDKKVSELTATSTALSNDLSQLKRDMDTLRAELRSQKVVEEELRVILSKTEAKLETETFGLKAKLKEKDETEKSLRQLIRDMELQLEEERKKKIASPPPTPASAPVPAPAPQKIDVSIPYDAAAKLAYEASGKSVPYGAFKTQYEADAVAQVKAKQPKREVAPPKKEPAKKATQKVAAPGAFFASVESAPLQPSPPKTPPPSVQETPGTDASAEDWSKLSPSAIRRKTVKELSSYLESVVSPSCRFYFIRFCLSFVESVDSSQTVSSDVVPLLLFMRQGVATNGPDGKALKKAELVDRVMALVPVA